MSQDNARLSSNDDQRTARRQAARDQWSRKDSAARTLSPDEMEDRQARLINAARKGRKEFNAAWDEIFHGKSPAPDPKTFLLNRQQRPRALK